MTLTGWSNDPGEVVYRPWRSRHFLVYRSWRFTGTGGERGALLCSRHHVSPCTVSSRPTRSGSLLLSTCSDFVGVTVQRKCHHAAWSLLVDDALRRGPGGPPAFRYLLTVLREMPRTRAVARMERPCSCACRIAFQRACWRGVGAARLTPGVRGLTSWAAGGRGAGNRAGTPPVPRTEAMRSSAGCPASAERDARSTPARGGASWVRIVSQWYYTASSPLGRSSTLTRARA